MAHQTSTPRARSGAPAAVPVTRLAVALRATRVTAHCAVALSAALACASVASDVQAQGGRGGRGGRAAYIAFDTTAFAIANVRVIDGTGAPSRANQNLVVRDGKIAVLGDAARTPIPSGIRVLDGTGKSVFPGLVMMHEHTYYPNGGGVYGNYTESFSRLYLAGGVTSMRTAGNTNGYSDFAVRDAINAGQKAGPWIDATAPYIQGPGGVAGQLHIVKDADEARRMVNYWADVGATSFKAYMNVTRDELRATVEEAHKRGLKVTGHLCSVTFREAADIGIDNLEHAFFVATDFFPNKQPDVCPGQNPGMQTIATLDTAGTPFKELVRHLVEKRVALTSTLTVFETFTPGRPMPPGLDVLTPQLKEQFERTYANTARNANSLYSTLYAKAAAMEVAFVRAGGTLLVGTDPTGGGGVIPGYSNQRAIELLVEAGLTPVEAIKVATLNGAAYLKRDALVGSIAVGKQADLVLVTGDPSAHVADVRRVELVFKQGVAYDPAKLIESVRGRVGVF